jgi:hypothetical protein
MEHLSFFQPLIEIVARNLLSVYLKPNNIKARLNTIEAYCVYYPIYICIQRLGKQHINLIKGLIESLQEDPALFARILPRIGNIGPSKSFVSQQVKEQFRKNSSILYLPEPFLKELEVKNEINKIFNSVEQGNLEATSHEVEEKFKEKYKNGDLQVPGIEDVIEEALISVLTTLKCRKPLSSTILRTVLDNYYVVLVLERTLEFIPIIGTTILSPFLQPELMQRAEEQLKKIKLLLDSPYIKQELQKKEMELGFKYEEFKNSFYEVERLIRPY